MYLWRAGTVFVVVAKDPRFLCMKLPAQTQWYEMAAPPGSRGKDWEQCKSEGRQRNILSPPDWQKKPARDVMKTLLQSVPVTHLEGVWESPLKELFFEKTE